MINQPQPYITASFLFPALWSKIMLSKDPVQFSSVSQLCPTLCDPMNCSTPGLLSITNSWSSLRLMSIESVMPSSHLILCRPLLILPPIPPSIRVFSRDPEGSGIGPLQIHWPLVITKKPWSSLLMIIVVFIN